MEGTAMKKKTSKKLKLAEKLTKIHGLRLATNHNETMLRDAR
jgi:hypothetical protein